jgi:hypothetical protein
MEKTIYIYTNKLITMPKRKLTVTYYNTTNYPQGEELEQRKRKCNSDAERVLLLYELHKSMTPWEAHRKYLEYFGDIEKIVIGARIKGLCDKGLLYKSIEQVMEQEGALNNIVRLFPEEGFPDDFDMSTLDKIHIPLYFTSEGKVDAEKTRQDFETKLQIKLKEYE